MFQEFRFWKNEKLKKLTSLGLLDSLGYQMVIVGIYLQSYAFPVTPSPLHVTQELGKVCLHSRVVET